MTMPLSVRSGNRVLSRDSVTMKDQQPDWSRTRAALREMEGRLRCSACLSILNKPVCLGGCEHVFCRVCVDEKMGNECPVCHTPAWVKDVQINRQLDNIIQLCGKLNTLLDKDNGNKMDSCQDVSLKLNTTEGECKKKQIKMWFSPRRRNVRYILDCGANDQQRHSKSKQAQLFPPYEFVSSSPSVVHTNRKSIKQPKKPKKKTLQDINLEWGFEAQNQSMETVKEKEVMKSHRSVSFCSSVVEQNDCVPLNKNILEENESRLKKPEEDQANKSDGDLLSPVHQETRSEYASQLLNGNGQHKNEGESMSEEPTEDQPNIRKSVRCTRLRNISSESLKTEIKTPLKRKHHSFESPLSCSPKRMRKRQVKDRNYLSSEKSSCEQVANGNDDDKKPVHLETPSMSPSTPSSRNIDSRRTSQISANFQTSLSPISVAKKNHKGETMLHVASIKGDLQGVEEMLKSGANPNVKDNAGWTPLHEACNHGHTSVVELLLKHQALVNTTGYQNDTPLHDAVRNGHVAIVRLLLVHGASQEAVNIFGLRPVDYAETEEIKLALLQTQTSKEPLLQRPANVFQFREGATILLASGLSATQRTDFTKLAELLKAEISSSYNFSVTHIIVGEEPTLRTMKCMMGTLAGCWILRWSWVKTCLESRGQVPEELHEVQGGPQRARFNKEQLLPRLLDGCHFYFLGSFREHRKEDLIELVKAAGGQILNRQPKPDSDVTQTINTVAYHADADSDQRFCTQYIIYDKASKYVPSKVRQGKVWFAPSSWLIECITGFQLLPVPQG